MYRVSLIDKFKVDDSSYLDAIRLHQIELNEGSFDDDPIPEVIITKSDIVRLPASESVLVYFYDYKKGEMVCNLFTKVKEKTK